MKLTPLLLLPAALLFSGCMPTGEERPKTAAPAAAASGRAVFDANGCAQCHRIGNQGGRGGPDLTRAGSDPRHTAAWIIEHVKNPKSHNPGSSMPGFEGRISDSDLAALGEYLAGLK